MSLSLCHFCLSDCELWWAVSVCPWRHSVIAWLVMACLSKSQNLYAWTEEQKRDMPVSFTAAKSIGSGRRHHREKWRSSSSELSALCKDPVEQWRAADMQSGWRISKNLCWCWEIRPNLSWQKPPADIGKCSGSPPVPMRGECDRDDDRGRGNRFITAGVVLTVKELVLGFISYAWITLSLVAILEWKETPCL